ncbi:MAG: excinuclease ABC subunit UvrC [Oscillospiraceae bacterium]|nr:excinuclease ABC subunit UvrC [Oscillospiraceae bacterium]
MENINNAEETKEKFEEAEKTEDSKSVKERIKPLKKKALSLPHKSGVYLMKNNKNKIIYIGKAKYLANRVSQYFIFYPHRDYKTNKLVENIYDFDFIVTGNEIEALILENQLIKLHAPKYNIRLKDDKNYPYLKINIQSEYPNLSVVRARAASDKSLFFGPYSNKGSIYELIDEIDKHFKLPACSNEFPRDINKRRPCLNLRIGRCMGVCTGSINAEEYKNIINDVILFIKGDYENLIKFYNANMISASENLDFEKAAQFRDRKSALEKLRSKQRIVAAPDIDEDVFGVYVGDTSSCVSVFNIRSGVMVDKITEHFAYDEILDEEGFMQYLQEYYINRSFIPKQILSSVNISEENINLLQDWLSEKTKTKVKIICPKKGDQKITVNLAVTNSKENQRLYKEKYSRDTNKLAAIAKILSLEVLPQRIEAYDVSNSGSDNITCGMIVIQDGAFKKSDYKSFNIKTVTDTQDDYASMSEAIERRFRNYLEIKNGESKTSGENGFAKLPDLILLDGGKGHVSVIKKVLKDFAAGNVEGGVQQCKEIAEIPVFGMVKDEFHKTRVLTNGEKEINIAKDQTVFILFYKIQEEVHRYSLKRMDTKRRKTVKTSVLQNIKGLGAAKIKNLFDQFKSIDEIEKATVDELVKVKGVTKTDAENIINYFNSMRNPEEIKTKEKETESEGVI